MTIHNNKFKIGEEVWVKGRIGKIETKKGKDGKLQDKIEYSIMGMDNKTNDMMFDCIEATEEDIKLDITGR